MTLYIILIVLIIVFYFIRLKTVYVFTVILLFLLIFRSGVFIVNEGSQVVLTQFGKVIGEPYTQAGLYFKVPFIWKANYFDKRIFTEEDLQAFVATKDAYFISVDTVVNWRIVNASLFFQNMDSLAIARDLLKNIVSGSVREIVAKYELVETVRSKNINSSLYSPFAADDPKLGHELGVHRTVVFGRSQLTQMMKEQNYNYTLDYGIEIVAVLVRNIRYGTTVEKSINRRMVLERLTKAQELRSTGLKIFQEIEGEIQRKYQSIVAPAKKEADLIKGRADAEATNIYSQAYGLDIDFYNYWRTLMAYEEGIPPKSQGVILSTDNDFLRLLNNRNTKIIPPK